MHLGMPPLPGIVSACAFCLAAMLLAAAPSRAQNPTGSLRGLVQDTSHSRIPSARITARAAGLSIIREATSDDRGEFRIDDLVPGTFYVVVIAAGFAEASSDVSVRISSVLEMNVTMIPAVVRQSVTVRGQASSITTQPLDAASARFNALRARSRGSRLGPKHRRVSLRQSLQLQCALASLAETSLAASI
jgi:hypothetical protein